MYLVINNLDVFRKNIELISNLDLSSNILNEFKQKLIDYLLNEESKEKKILDSKTFNSKYDTTINLINNIAPIKVISANKKEEEIMVMFNEINSEIKKINLQEKIDALEDKVSLNLDEKLYSELLSLRNQLKSG